MKNVLLQEAIKLNRERKHKRGWQKIAGTLAAVVVFCTTYALILPAITMERTAECGIEAHEHTDGCYEQQTLYELQCVLDTTGVDIVIHSHSDVCYDDQGALRCTLPEVLEHVHTEACFETREVPCTLPEGEEHTHSEECAATESVQICALDEIRPHLHGESCYDAQGELLCQLPVAVVHDHSLLAVTEQTVSVLTCQIPEHIHEDACYPVVEETEPGSNGFLCGSGEHEHGEACADAEGNVICTIPEHTHEAACLVADLDLTADVETSGQWEATLAGLELTGKWPEDVLTVARSQLDYHESEKNCILVDGDLKGYTRYGQWYGHPYEDWCGMFVAFCLDYAGVEDFPVHAHCQSWIDALDAEALYRTADVYTPKPGDLIFFDNDRRENADLETDAEHVGLVVELIPATGNTPAQIKTIEGNSSDKVTYVTYDLDDPTIIGYGELPERMYYCGMDVHIHDESCTDESGAVTCTLEEHEHSESCTEINDEYISGSLPEICTLVEHIHGLMCYGDDSGEATCGMEEHLHTPACHGLAEAIFTYEDERVVMTVHVVSATGIPEGVSMAVTLLDVDNQTYASYADYAAANGDGDLVDLVGYQIKFYLAGQETELPDAEITAELTVKPVDSASPVMAASTATTWSLRSRSGADTEDSADETEDTSDIVTVTVLQENEGDVESQGTVTFENGQSDNNSLTFTLGKSRTIALASTTAPEFKVQFYANIPVYQYSTTAPSGKISLPVINTMLDGDGDGGSLPRNVGNDDETGTTNGILYLHLDQVSQTTTENPNGSSTLYTVHTESELREIYNEDTVTYSPGISLINIDKLQDNGNYSLNQIWVSQDNGATWTVYGTTAGNGVNVVSNLSALKFTNNTAATDGSIPITKNTVIRLVYDSTDGTYNNAANLFDYDITTTRYYRSAAASGNGYDTYDAALGSSSSRNIYQRTSQNGAGVGINSAWLDGSGNSANLAFGNRNTGVPYQDQSFNGATLNKYNSGGYKGCTFGLVTGYDFATDRLIYANGLAHQALFNDEAYYRTSVPGKTSYYRNALNFERTGDTYVLTGVNSSGAINGVQDNKLNYFFSPQSYSHIYTNNFWPLDGTVSDSTAGHDMLTGIQADETRRYTNGSTNGRFPPSDDGTLHNSYFGMQFAVEFELDGEYCGPLEYLFYGDDDMWVFLTDLNTGKSTMICDIGGVHSSVGSITNLWDYIPKNTAGNYVLTVFYTERGASGSSCYIEFTLPQVTSITQNTPTTGSVSVGKEAVKETIADAEYTFRFDLAAGEHTSIGLSDNYSYQIVDSSNNTTSGTIASGGTFKLKADEIITISGIPEGLNYTITEIFGTGMENAYNVNWVQSGSATINGSAITGTVEAAKTHVFTATNTASGMLTLTKEVDGAATDQVFVFEVTLTDENGAPISGTFGSHTFDENGRTEVSLRHSETATLLYLPVDARWTVTEQAVAGYKVTYQVDGTEVETATGTVAHNQNATVTVVNAAQYTLPNTGGPGTSHYTFGGLLILAAGLMYICKFGRMRRKGGYSRRS